MWWTVLWALARPAEAAPDALYFVLVDRFADGRPDAEGTVDRTDPQAWHGGDLRGLIDHLDEVPGGGFWLSPIQQARTEPVGEWGAFHGYWTADLRKPEPRLATEAEVRELAAALQDDGKELWLDLVTNHVGYEAELTTQHPEWFHGKGDVVDWADPVQAVTHDVHGLPDLNQDVDEVYAYLLEGATRWIRLAEPTGFRVDAVRHLPEGFLARFRADLRKVDPDIQLLGEVFDGSPTRLAARQEVDQLDRVFDFPLHYALKDAICGDQLPKLGAVLGQDHVYRDPSSLVTFLDNHDVARIRSACGDDLDAVTRAMALMTTLRGTPCITWGTEAALAGAEEPANRADMVFDDQPLRPALDALLALREAHHSLGRTALTEVLAVEEHRVVIGRQGDGEQAVLVVTGDEGTTWPLEGLGSDCVGHRVAGVAGPEGVGVAGGALVVPPNTVGVAVCQGVPGPSFARWFSVDRPQRTVRIAVPEGHVLVGSTERLGAWDPAKGHPSEGGFVTLSVPAGTVLDYKFVGREGDQWRWPDSGNRVHRVP